MIAPTQRWPEPVMTAPTPTQRWPAYRAPIRPTRPPIEPDQAPRIERHLGCRPRG
jgi:hypothetical protein